MNRYQNTRKLSNNQYETFDYPELKENNNDIYITFKQGDRLDIIAYRYYNDPKMWPFIAIANDIQNPLNIPTGSIIRIPASLEY